MKYLAVIVIFLVAVMSKVHSQDIAEMNFDKFQHHLQKQTDTVYVINFWATWCKPCIEEMPHFLKVAEEKKDAKVKFIFVSLDFPQNKQKRLIPYVKNNNIKEKVILLNDPNSNKWINLVDKTWSGSIPATIVYKKSDKEFYEGQLSENELLNMIDNKL